MFSRSPFCKGRAAVLGWMLSSALVNAAPPTPESLNGRELAISINNQAIQAERRRDFVTEETLLRKSLRIFEEGEESDTLAAGSVLNNLALCLQQQHRYGEADQLYSRSFAVIRSTAGEKSAEFAKALTNSGLFSFDRGDYASALVKGRKALEIETALGNLWGDARASTLNNLAATSANVGRDEEAELMCREALAIEAKLPSEFDAKYPETLNNLAVVEQHTKRFELARQHELQALEMLQTHYGESNPLTAIIWNNLGMVAAGQNDLAEAKRYFARALAFWLQNNGASSWNYAAALSNCASLEARAGHHKRALTMYERVLEIDGSVLGTEHPRVATDLSNVASQLFAEKKYEDALPLLTRAETIAEKSAGPNSFDVARLWHGVGVCLGAMKSYAAASDSYKNAIHALEISQGVQAPLLTIYLRDYAAVLRQKERFAEAEQAEVRALGIEVRGKISGTT